MLPYMEAELENLGKKVILKEEREERERERERKKLKTNDYVVPKEKNIENAAGITTQQNKEDNYDDIVPKEKKVEYTAVTWETMTQNDRRLWLKQRPVLNTPAVGFW